MHLNLLIEGISSLGNSILRNKYIIMSELTSLDIPEFTVQSRGYW